MYPNPTKRNIMAWFHTLPVDRQVLVICLAQHLQPVKPKTWAMPCPGVRRAYQLRPRCARWTVEV